MPQNTTSEERSWKIAAAIMLFSLLPLAALTLDYSPVVSSERIQHNSAVIAGLFQPEMP